MGAREVAVVLVGSVTLAGCTTRHTLGRLDDPAARARVEDLIAHRTVYAEVTPLMSPYRDRPRVVGITDAGLRLVAYPSATPVDVPAARVQYVSTFDHLRGALDGALVGIPAFFVGGVLGIALNEALASSCTADCPAKHSSGWELGLLLGGIAGVLVGGIGAGIGAAAGHEDRYVPGGRSNVPDQGDSVGGLYGYGGLK